MSGKFITFEGADKLGKSTQIEALYKYLLDKGEKVIKTREPGSTKLGSKIRELLLNSEEPITPKAQLFLFQADRAIHMKEVILPHLEEGYTILCDRFILSTLVYQSKFNGLDERTVIDMCGYATNWLIPDKYFVFQGKRLNEECDDEYEKQLGNNSHEKLNNYYYEYSQQVKNCVLINANREKEVVFNDIISHL